MFKLKKGKIDIMRILRSMLFILFMLQASTMALAGSLLKAVDTRLIAFLGVLILWLLVGYGLGIIVRRLITSLAQWVGIGVLLLIALSTLRLANIDFNGIATTSSRVITEGYGSLFEVVTSNLVATCFFLLGILLSRNDGD